MVRSDLKYSPRAIAPDWCAAADGEGGTNCAAFAVPLRSRPFDAGITVLT
jgi:hypothetical protein